MHGVGTCRSRAVQRRILLSVLCGAAAVFAGCGDDAQVGRVDGIVRLDGSPVTTGTVRFVPGAGRAAEGKIQSDGTFTLGTFGKSDGALVGKHQVVIIAYEPSRRAGGGPPDFRVPSPKIKPLVPMKYMAPGTSGLTFEVKPGTNHAELDLKSR
jgi:hypothetical protein